MYIFKPIVSAVLQVTTGPKMFDIIVCNVVCGLFVSLSHV